MEEVSDAMHTEKRTSVGWGTIALAMVALLVTYALAVGPFVMMVDKKVLSPRASAILAKIYLPIEWAYDSSLLHKPVGMYLHLWSKRFKANGELR